MTRRSLLIHVFPAASHFLAWSPGASPAKGMFVITKLFAHALGDFSVQIHLESHQFPVFHEGERRGRGVDRGTQFLAGIGRSAFTVPITSPVQAIAANKTRTCNRFIL